VDWTARRGGPGHTAREGSVERLGAPTTLDPVIRFEKVVKAYPGQARPALDQVTVDVDKGEFVFLVGASGSGKSTFLRLVLREYRSTSGRIYVAGKEINRLASWKVPRMRRQIGTVFQDFRLLPNKTVSENVAFALQVIGRSRSEISKVVPETLELVGLDGKATGCPTSSPAASSSGSRSPGRS
jgi:cell division transport system ATP-binding protein